MKSTVRQYARSSPSIFWEGVAQPEPKRGACVAVRTGVPGACRRDLQVIETVGEIGHRLTPGMKRKILAENAARLFHIVLAEKKLELSLTKPTEIDRGSAIAVA
ncbi:MAG TPA: hypothetical protein VIT91_17895 [Chthoniobacterales bacterium]